MPRSKRGGEFTSLNLFGRIRSERGRFVDDVNVYLRILFREKEGKYMSLEGDEMTEREALARAASADPSGPWRFFTLRDPRPAPVFRGDVTQFLEKSREYRRYNRFLDKISKRMVLPEQGCDSTFDKFIWCRGEITGRTIHPGCGEIFSGSMLALAGLGVEFVDPRYDGRKYSYDGEDMVISDVSVPNPTGTGMAKRQPYLPRCKSVLKISAEGRKEARVVKKARPHNQELIVASWVEKVDLEEIKREMVRTNRVRNEVQRGVYPEADRDNDEKMYECLLHAMKIAKAHVEEVRERIPFRVPARKEKRVDSAHVAKFKRFMEQPNFMHPYPCRMEGSEMVDVIGTVEQWMREGVSALECASAVQNYLLRTGQDPLRSYN